MLESRLDHAGLVVATDARTRLVVYLDVLARWNRKLNLTAFDLDAPTDEAVDRLIIEPVLASGFCAGGKTALDIGSGGGSPAIPVLVVCNKLSMTLVEARERKGAFLREAVRVLQLDATVAVTRFEDFVQAQPLDHGQVRTFDVLTMRAVKASDEIWRAVASVLAPSGCMVWFSNRNEVDANMGLLGSLGLHQDHIADRFRVIRRTMPD